MLIRCRTDLQLPFGRHGKPRPAAAGAIFPDAIKLFFKTSEFAKTLCDRLRSLALRFTATLWRHVFPEQCVIQATTAVALQWRPDIGGQIADMSQ